MMLEIAQVDAVKGYGPNHSNFTSASSLLYTMHFFLYILRVPSAFAASIAFKISLFRSRSHFSIQ